MRRERSKEILPSGVFLTLNVVNILNEYLRATTVNFRHRFLKLLKCYFIIHIILFVCLYSGTKNGRLTNFNYCLTSIFNDL